MKKDEIEVAVGRAVKRLRKARGQTVTGLSAEAGVSQAMISRIEAGQVSPSLGTIAALAETLQVPVMALLSETGDTGDVHHVKAGEGLPSRRVAPDHVHEYLLLGKHVGVRPFFCCQSPIERRVLNPANPSAPPTSYPCLIKPF